MNAFTKSSVVSKTLVDTFKFVENVTYLFFRGLSRIFNILNLCLMDRCVVSRWAMDGR